MKIIINGKHTEKLTEALKVAQDRCTARTLTCSDIERILEQATEKLNISKANMKGTRLEYTGAEQFPRAYKYRPESTHFTAEHNGRHWVIIYLDRYTCPNRRDNTSLILSELTRAAILDTFNAFYAH